MTLRFVFAVAILLNCNIIWQCSGQTDDNNITARIIRNGKDANYPDNFDLPLIREPINFGSSGFGRSNVLNGFQFADIIGYKPLPNILDCLKACTVTDKCKAVNYVNSLLWCVLLTSATDVSRSQELWVDKLVDSRHVYFMEGPKSNPPQRKIRNIMHEKVWLPGVSYYPPNLQLKRARIIGGADAAPFSYPWIVRLMSCDPNNPRACAVCGGTLIPATMDNNNIRDSSDLIITAAHCVVENGVTTEPPQMKVKIANHREDITEASEMQPGVRRVISHAGFDDDLNNDIAIVQLKTPVFYNDVIRPVRLPTQDFPSDPSSCIAIGWGRYLDTSPQAKVLQETILIVEPYAKCAEGWPGTDFVATKRLCASGANQRSSTCQGDSGGPIFCPERSGTSTCYTLYGVTSYGDAEGCLNRPGVFTRVNSFVPWLKNVVSSLNSLADNKHHKI